MTREEAIMILENNRPSCGERIIFKESEVYEAMSMAIEALSVESCEDAVSRKAAIDAIKSADNMLNSKQLALYAAMDNIRLLPSAQSKRKQMSNKEWVDFLSEQFDVSRTSAREMLHGLMRWKAEDNFKKQYSGGRNEKG